MTKPAAAPRRAHKSLRLRLVLGLALASSLLWGGVAAWRINSLEHELNAMLDDRLIASARMVASIVQQLQPAADGSPPTAEQLHSVIGRDGVACEVSLARSEVEVVPLARTGDAPAQSTLGEPGFQEIRKGGKAWRTYVLAEGELRVATSDPLAQREQLVRTAVLALAVPFAIALAVVWLLVWWVATLGLRPLERLRRELATRAPTALEPVHTGEDTRELSPLVASLNALLARTSAAIAHERRWTADAAHELRTPLTAIKTHVQVARMALAAPGRVDTAAQALQAAEQGIAHMHATIEQLLQLARIEGEALAAPQEASGEAIVQAFEHAVQQSLQGREGARGAAPAAVQTRCAPAPGAPEWSDVRIALPAPLLTSAIGNLLDNALRHHRGEAAVECTLRLLRTPSPRRPHGAIAFEVRDHGPGMSAEECAQATQRFWRKEPMGSGSGLGLTIARRIAESAGGTLELRPADPGLVATLELPLLAG
ncbi:ATP-binding protein [Melaminivora alkalimesophila]|uniref:histidine kinase n=1 Tax=Melaminivora alkalimesophila TaxID=1165852 RepID=A0A317RHK3_9BURK|nr:ATP-binding protein [Melaminivora alkalimesophila]PWW48925.1 signal transduction histidine kinase [Melaminivora alkalimesophila]